MTDRLGLRPEHVVVDVGSGTGILSALFLDRGHRVIGVEPNGAMRARAEAVFAGNSLFESVDGTAEATGLPTDVADVVVAGQAFHWFRVSRAAAELGRVLRASGHAVVLWNLAQPAGHAFTRAYVAFLHAWGRDWGRIAASQADPASLARFFRDGVYEAAEIPNTQELDAASWRGRIESSSSMPGPEDSRHQDMVRALEKLFDAHQEGGRVQIRYTTAVYWGKL